MASHPAAAPLLPWRTGLAYGGLAAPLAFVSLPLYVNLPYHYASVAGAPLAGLGAVLLATRAFDALVDPAIGRQADRLLRRGMRPAWWAAALASLLMVLGFWALWHPPRGAQAAMLGWLACSLLVCTLAYSFVTIVHQAWGTRWGGQPVWRARVTAWREGATLGGVLLASVLPAWLGFDTTSAVLALGLALGLVGLYRLKAPVTLPQQATADTSRISPWADAGFRRLLAVFMVNGVAAAIPATLLPFFVADRLQVPGMQPLLLLCFFGAAALGLPLWVKAVSRWGLAPSWRAGMLASVLAFGFTPWLGTGDGLAFAVICLASGLALGADLALPGALLTGVIHESGQGGQGEGRYLGWWTCATKLNLALAAGLALPLLSVAGYRSGSTDPAGLQALAWAYGGLPCLLKLAAAGLLWRAERLHSSWRHT
ncbi:MFS transporter [Delftia tsuruhatensis]|uniref:MFS transporter n=1 Tax=Delftia tsuruhatensis TaxID=180282 RepID=UPI002443ACA0|nr:MFS transporter [Delftia tsuruhatensis]MDH0775013.1 MFS transporter [Delftia tsuruhatensis]MDH1458975.1 MFS transporter [Delftia tsuruhatensis]MDH1824505.1 MFS transporter [Delftia tsuruhatensis]WGG11774.1 MFS transporter [Delftia tsuruhatensis]